MYEQLLNWGIEGLCLVFIATWRALPLLVIVLLADLIWRRQIASKYHALLWTLVVVRLMLPMSVTSSWSLHGPLDRWVSSLAEAPETDAYDTQTVYQANLLAMQVDDEPWAAQAGLDSATETLEAGPFWDEIVFLSFVSLWGLVAAGLILRSLIAHSRFAWRLRSCRELNDPELVDLVLRECDSLRVSRRPKLKEVAELSTPAVFGLFRSVICLPTGVVESLSTNQLRWILRHELAHVRRRDAWLLSFASIMRSLHWINPLAWLAVSRMRLHTEAAADDLALDRSTPGEAIAYGRLLLNLAESASSRSAAPAIGLLQFVSGGRLRGRIERLTRDRLPSRLWKRWSLGMAILALAAVSLTDAAEHSESPQPAIHLPSTEFDVVLPQAEDAGPTSIRTYEISSVLEKIREIEPQHDAEKYLLAFHQLRPGQPSFRIENGQLIAELTESRHLELSRMLEAWRLSGPRQISVEVRVITADLRQASSLDWSSERIGGLEQRGSQPLVATLASHDQMKRFVQEVQSTVRGNILFAPKVTFFNGQTGTISDLVQRPFVVSITPQADGSHQPVIRVFEEGFKVTLQPQTIGDGSVELTVDLESSKINDVALANLPFRHPVAPHPNVTVQVPSVSTTGIRSTVRLQSEETLLIAAPQVFDDKNPEASTTALFYAFTPRLLDVEPSSDKTTP